MNRILLILFVLIGYQSPGQSSDVLLLKKHNKTVKRYFAGTDIDITTTTGAYINGSITKIKNDSLFLEVFVIRQTPTNLGVYVLDTVTTYYYKYHYNQIKAIGKTGKGFDLSASAASLMGGGALLMVASGVVFLADRNKFSPPLLIAAASLAGIGYLMAKTGGKGMMIGKKYSLVYLGISDNKKM
ncbi:MAG: hypothetical protein ABI707_19340 [Ferruginibacter sp.]